MARHQAVNMGTSAYDLDRWSALPEIPDYQTGQTPRQEAPHPREQARRRAEAKRMPRQRVSKFAILGCLFIGMLLLAVVFAHMHLSLIASEMVQLENQMAELREDAMHLAVAHENVFAETELERFARDELGMVDAARGQVIYIGNSITGDVAEVIRAPEEEQYGTLYRMAGLFGSLLEYLPFW